MSICVTHIARVSSSACWKVLMTLLEREFGLPGVNSTFLPSTLSKASQPQVSFNLECSFPVWSTQYHESSVPRLGSHSRVIGTFQEKLCHCCCRKLPVAQAPGETVWPSGGKWKGHLGEHGNPTGSSMLMKKGLSHTLNEVFERREPALPTCWAHPSHTGSYESQSLYSGII